MEAENFSATGEVNLLSPWENNRFQDFDQKQDSEKMQELNLVNLAISDFNSGASSLYESPFSNSSSYPNFSTRAELERKSSSGAFKSDLSAELKAEANLPVLIFTKTQTDEAARNKQVEKIAEELANFIGSAEKSLDIAIYSYNLKNPRAQELLVSALNDRAEHGVEVRLAYFQAEPRKAAESNEEASSEKEASGEEEASMMAAFLEKLDPRISGHNSANPSAVKLPAELSDEVSREPISGGGSLMHSKYVIKDAGTKNAAVWTGSANWTDDAFGSQDNNIIQLRSKEVADIFKTNFEELWESGNLQGTGVNSRKTVKVGDSTVTVAFSPGDGDYIDSEIARRIASAEHNIHIASMDVSNREILEAIVKELDEGTKVDGIYDRSQMNVVIKQWERNNSIEMLALWNKVQEHLLAKDSERGMREMMHNKVVQIDDRVVVTGSFNFTRNAVRNSENIVIIENPVLAKQYGAYINDLLISYGGMIEAKN